MEVAFGPANHPLVGAGVRQCGPSFAILAWWGATGEYIRSCHVRAVVGNPPAQVMNAGAAFHSANQQEGCSIAEVSVTALQEKIFNVVGSGTMGSSLRRMLRMLRRTSSTRSVASAS